MRQNGAQKYPELAPRAASPPARRVLARLLANSPGDKKAKVAPGPQIGQEHTVAICQAIASHYFKLLRRPGTDTTFMINVAPSILASALRNATLRPSHALHRVKERGGPQGTTVKGNTGELFLRPPRSRGPDTGALRSRLPDSNLYEAMATKKTPGARAE